MSRNDVILLLEHDKTMQQVRHLIHRAYSVSARLFTHLFDSYPIIPVSIPGSFLFIILELEGCVKLSGQRGFCL